MPAVSELSADGLWKKEWNGLRVGLDFGFGKDTFDLTKWRLHFGSLSNVTHDTGNGWLKIDGDVGVYYDDPALPKVDTIWVAAETWYQGCAHYLPAVSCMIDMDVNPGDHLYWQQAWIITCTDGRMRLCWSDDWAVSCLIPTGAGPAGAWNWYSIYTEPRTTDHWFLGSDNDTNWVQQNFDSNIFGKTGKGGLFAVQGTTGTTPARVRRYREYENGTSTGIITIIDVPGRHEIRIVRDAGQFGAATITHQNVDADPRTITSDAIGFPVPPNSAKKNGPLTRLELWAIGGGAPISTFTPIPRATYDVDGVNWGDVYRFNPGGFFEGEVLPPPEPEPPAEVTCPPEFAGVDLAIGDCQGGIETTPLDCEGGISVVFVDCLSGFDICPDPETGEVLVPQITQDSSGLVVSDAFTRADSSTIGGNWVEQQTDWEIISENLERVSNAAQGIIEEQTPASTTQFIQADVQVSNTAIPFGLISKSTFPATTGYIMWLDIAGGLLKMYEKVTGLVQSSAGAWSANIAYTHQLFVAPDVQEGTVVDNTATVITIAHTGSLYNATSGFAGFQSGNGHAQELAYNFIHCNNRNVRVTGLSTGEQIAIVGPSDSIVYQATETAGVVDVLIDRFSGVLDQSEIVPEAGWSALLWLDAAGDEILRWDSSDVGFVGVWPGDRYTVARV